MVKVRDWMLVQKADAAFTNVIQSSDRAICFERFNFLLLLMVKKMILECVVCVKHAPRRSEKKNRKTQNKILATKLMFVNLLVFYNVTAVAQW